jgi:hypothetical protein
MSLVVFWWYTGGVGYNMVIRDKVTSCTRIYILAQCRYIFPNSNTLSLHLHILLTRRYYQTSLPRHLVIYILSVTTLPVPAVYSYSYIIFNMSHHVSAYTSFVLYLFLSLPRSTYTHTHTQLPFPVIERPYLGSRIL